MLTSPEIGTAPSSDDRAFLLCPQCGNQHLNHRQVRVFDRNEDDVEVILTKVIGNRSVVETLPNDTSDNPSARRDGLVVDFSCEECGRASSLLLAQHKGSTEIGWRWY